MPRTMIWLATVIRVAIAPVLLRLVAGFGLRMPAAAVGVGLTALAAVRQLIAVNADLHATRAELADLAVAGEHDRLARELHDLLGRTLSLIAVKSRAG